MSAGSRLKSVILLTRSNRTAIVGQASWKLPRLRASQCEAKVGEEWISSVSLDAWRAASIASFTRSKALPTAGSIRSAVAVMTIWRGWRRNSCSPRWSSSSLIW